MPDNDLHIDSLSRSKGEPINKAYDTNRENDTFKTPSITLEDIDYAIVYHLQSNLAFEVLENGNTIPVPVMMASGEKWAQIRNHGYLRGKDNKIMTPIIVVKRESMTPDDRVPKLAIPNLIGGSSIIIFPATQQNNRHDWIHKTNNTKESKEYFISVLPDYMRITYTIYIWTSLQAQMNAIVEQFPLQDNLVWGDVMQFVTVIQDYSFETINDSGEDRLVRCTIPIEVSGILQNEFEAKQSTVQKAYSIKRIDFKNDMEQTEIYVDHKPRIIRPAKPRLPSKDF